MRDHPFDASVVSLPTKIPLFPLRQAVLLPRGRLPLNIFEPRYLAMTEYALGHGRVIGMIRPRTEEGVSPPLYETGCAGRISSFTQTDDGRYLITLTGLSRFCLKGETLDANGFRLGTVDWSPFPDDTTEYAEESPVLRERLLELLVVYLKEVGLTADWDSMEGASSETLVNSIAMSCPFDAEEQQALLEAPTLEQRAHILITMMEMSVAGTQGPHQDVPSAKLQ
ncbi:MAG: LON peptidase substrate-binding domain-containing protein [Pseudomonadota bacterium]